MKFPRKKKSDWRDSDLRLWISKEKKTERENHFIFFFDDAPSGGQYFEHNGNGTCPIFMADILFINLEMGKNRKIG